MSEYADILKRISESPETINDHDISVLRRECRDNPADALAPALLLKYADSRLDEEERRLARARVSLNTSDPRRLIKFIDPSGKGFDRFYPEADANPRPSTEGAIDLFLETYGHRSADEDALLERMILNPVPDYAEQLAREASENHSETTMPRTEQDTLIDSFLATHQPPREPQTDVIPVPAAKKEKPATTKKTEKAQNPSLLSQSLAKIFIKQGRYERAYEIIYNLSLNYPEKSIYFADQLRFLKKLIINQRYNKQ